MDWHLNWCFHQRLPFMPYGKTISAVLSFGKNKDSIWNVKSHPINFVRETKLSDCKSHSGHTGSLTWCSGSYWFSWGHYRFSKGKTQNFTVSINWTEIIFVWCMFSTGSQFPGTLLYLTTNLLSTINSRGLTQMEQRLLHILVCFWDNATPPEKHGISPSFTLMTSVHLTIDLSEKIQKHFHNDFWWVFERLFNVSRYPPGSEIRRDPSPGGGNPESRQYGG